MPMSIVTLPILCDVTADSNCDFMSLSLLTASCDIACTFRHFDWKWLRPLHFLHTLPHAGNSFLLFFFFFLRWWDLPQTLQPSTKSCLPLLSGLSAFFLVLWVSIFPSLPYRPMTTLCHLINVCPCHFLCLFAGKFMCTTNVYGLL